MRRAGIGGEIRSPDGFHPVRQPPVGIAGGDPDGLGAEVEPDERAALRQERGDLGKRQNDTGHGGGLAHF